MFADDDHVFLAPRRESKGWLFVSEQNANDFTVQESSGGSRNVSFSYRIVAKRKGHRRRPAGASAGRHCLELANVPDAARSTDSVAPLPPQPVSMSLEA